MVKYQMKYQKASKPRSTVGPWLALALSSWIAGSTAACGVSDKDLNAGSGASAGSGGTGATGNVGNSGGTDATGGDSALPTTCKEGSRQCNGNTPQTCNADGVWENGAECGGSEKVCNAGKCSAYRLVNAGIDSFGVRPAEGMAYILKEQTLSASPRTCAKDGFCVTGGIR